MLKKRASSIPYYSYSSLAVILLVTTVTFCYYWDTVPSVSQDPV